MVYATADRLCACRTVILGRSSTCATQQALLGVSPTCRAQARRFGLVVIGSRRLLAEADAAAVELQAAVG